MSEEDPHPDENHRLIEWLVRLSSASPAEERSPATVRMYARFPRPYADLIRRGAEEAGIPAGEMIQRLCVLALSATPTSEPGPPPDDARALCAALGELIAAARAAAEGGAEASLQASGKVRRLREALAEAERVLLKRCGRAGPPSVS